MNKQDYQRLMTALCATVGLDSTSEVVESQHLVVDGTAVGVIFDEAISRTRIFIYIDLGPVPEGGLAELHRRMLTSNVKADGLASGHFGIHPRLGNALFHIRMNFSEELTGAELAKFLQYQVAHLHRWIERFAASSQKNKTRPGNTSTAGRLAFNRTPRPV